MSLAYAGHTEASGELTSKKTSCLLLWVTQFERFDTGRGLCRATQSEPILCTRNVHFVIGHRCAVSGFVTPAKRFLARQGPAVTACFGGNRW